MTKSQLERYFNWLSAKAFADPVLRAMPMSPRIDRIWNDLRLDEAFMELAGAVDGSDSDVVALLATGMSRRAERPDDEAMAVLERMYVCAGWKPFARRWKRGTVA